MTKRVRLVPPPVDPRDGEVWVREDRRGVVHVEGWKTDGQPVTFTRYSELERWAKARNLTVRFRPRSVEQPATQRRHPQ